MANTLYFSANGDATTKVVQFYNPVLQTWVDGTLVDSATRKYTATMAGIPAGTYTGLKSRLKGSNPEIISIYSEGVVVRDGNTTPTPTALTVTFTIASTTAVTGGTLSYSAAANGGTAPYQHLVHAENEDTGEVKEVGSASTPAYAGIWQNLPAGKYAVTDTVTDAAGTSKISSVRRVVVSAGTAPVVPITLSVTNADKSLNTAATGTPSALSETVIRAAGPAQIEADLTFDATIFASKAEDTMIGVWQGSTYIGHVQATQAGLNTKTITLPGGTLQDYRFVDGPQTRIDDAGEVLYSSLVSVTLRGATTATKQGWVRKSTCIAFTFDSIGNGFGSTDPVHYAWIMELRRTQPTIDFVIVQSWGYASYGRTLNTAALRAEHARQIMYGLGSATEAHWYDARATNDHGFGFSTPSEMKAYKQAMIAELRRLPGGAGVNIHMQTPINKADTGSGGGRAGTMAQYAQAIVDIGAADASIHIVDTIDWIVSLFDGLHPNDAGHKVMAAKVLAALFGQNVPFDTDTYATVIGSENFGPGAFSVLARIKATSNSSDSIIACKAHFEDNGSGGTKVVGLFGLYLNSLTGKITASLCGVNGGSVAEVVSKLAIVLNQYYNIALVFDGTTLWLYVNGEVSSIAISAPVGNSTDRIWISGTYDQREGKRVLAFVGELVNLAVLPAGLSEATVKDIFSRDCRLVAAEYTAPAGYIFSTLARPAGATQLANLSDSTRPLQLNGGGATQTIYANSAAFVAPDFVKNDEGRTAYTETFGRRGTLSFSGTKLSVRGNTFSAGGKLRLTVDGESVVVNTYSATTINDVEFWTFNLPAGNHTLTVEKADNDGTYVVVFAFVLTR